MVDALSAVTATSTITPTALSAGITPTTPITTTITSLPSTLTDLSRQVQLPVNVTTPISTDDILTVNTPQGPLTLSLAQLTGTQQQNLIQQLSAFLSTQRPFTLVIQPGSPPDQAIILLPITGVSQATASQQLHTQAQTQSQLQTLSSLEAPVIVDPRSPVTVGSTLTAIILPTQSTPPQEMQETSSQSTITQTQVPTLISDAMQSESAPTPTAVLNLPNTLGVGNPISLHIDQIISNLAAQSDVAQNTNQYTATVASTTSNGQIILSIGSSQLYVKETVTAPIGTSFLVSLEPLKEADTAISITTLHSLPSLPEVLSSLTQIETKILENLFDTRIPQFNNALGGALLFFMSSLKQGNLKSWLGADAIDALSYNGKSTLITKLMQELANTGEGVKDSSVGEWKSYPLPIYVSNNFQVFNFYVHNNSDRPFTKGSDTQAGSGYLRFLIDMRMSKLGLIQLDGLVQPKKLDVIVRSEHTLPDGLHQELRETYIRTLSSIDYAGSLAFQVGHQHWLNIQKEAAKTTMVT